MRARDFIRQFSDPKINGPKFDNKMPPEKRDAINICNIPYNLRNYHVEAVHYDDDVIAMLWVTEDWDDDVNSLVNEIVRYYNYLAKINRLESDVSLEITIGTKDARESKYYDRVIARNGG